MSHRCSISVQYLKLLDRILVLTELSILHRKYIVIVRMMHIVKAAILNLYLFSAMMIWNITAYHLNHEELLLPSFKST